jgi:spoIIIJ-associated protein
MTKTVKEKSTETQISEALSELLSNLQVKATLEVVKGEDDHYQVNISTEETGLLIGHFGETINSLQLLLGVVLYKQTGKWTRVILEVGDYRKQREENIKEMVNRIALEVETTKNPVVLPFLTPLERRTVHLILSDNPKVVSESSGEGRDRRITIKLR